MHKSPPQKLPVEASWNVEKCSVICRLINVCEGLRAWQALVFIVETGKQSGLSSLQRPANTPGFKLKLLTSSLSHGETKVSIAVPSAE